MKHVRKQYNRFSFRICIVGVQVDAGQSYETEQEAGIYADLTKHYLRTVFALDLQPSLDGELFSSLAYSRNVDLSSPYSVLKAVPERVQHFINEHQAELDAILSNKPERKPWHALRGSPEFYSVEAVREWVQACERAELDVEAFAARNETWFLTVMAGASKRSTEILNTIGLALKMHAGVTRPKLTERVRLLTELQANLKATEEYVRALVVQFSAEQSKAVAEMARLEATRPSLT